MYPRLSRVLLGTLLLMTLAMSTGQAQTSRQTIAKFGASHVTGFSLPADRPTTATLAQQAGVHYAREDFAWSGMEPSPGVYEWSTTDDSVAVNARHNLTTVADLAYTPVFYSPYPQGNAGYSGSLYPPTSQAGLNAWSAFVTATVTRYKSQIKYWTIWPNVDDREFYWPADPNNKHVPEYLAVLQRAYTAIKTVDPSAVVITAAMDTVFLEAMLDLGGASAFDAVGVHNYGNSQVPLQAIPEASYIQIGLQPLRDVLNRRANGKTLWIDETAWLDAGPGAISADTHAAYTIRSLLMQDAVPYVDTVLWTDLIDPPGGGYGMLLHSDLSKKLAYSAYQSMTTALNNASFLRQVPPPATARQVADDFETNRPYILYKDPAIGGAYSRTSTVAHTGSFSGKLDYDFRTTVAGTISYAPPTQYIPISGAPSRIRIWAKGTGGPAPVLLVNFQDANNKYFGAVMGFVSGTDWTEYVLPLDTPPGTTHLLQSDPDTSFQYPLTFTGFTVASWALSTHAGNGTIYVDDIQFDSGPSVYQYQYGNGSGEVRALWTLGPTVVS